MLILPTAAPKPHTVRIQSVTKLSDLAFRINCKVPNVDYVSMSDELYGIFDSALDIEHDQDNVFVFKNHLGMKQSNVQRPHRFNMQGQRHESRPLRS